MHHEQGLHARLRAGTRAAHDAVEAAFDLPARLATRATYRDLLVRLYGLHAGFERAARPHLAGTALGGSRRLDLLAQDLAVFGTGPAELRALPRPPAAAAIVRDRAGAVGAAYVLEGSALGGLLIAREVEHRIGLNAATGAGFFAGDGRATHERWRGFCAALDAVGPTLDADRVVAAARETFAAVGDWLAPAAARRAA